MASMAIAIRSHGVHFRSAVFSRNVDSGQNPAENLLVSGPDAGVHDVDVDALARELAVDAISVEGQLGLIDAVKMPCSAHWGREGE